MSDRSMGVLQEADEERARRKDNPDWPNDAIWQMRKYLMHCWDWSAKDVQDLSPADLVELYELTRAEEPVYERSEESKAALDHRGTP